MLSLLQASSHHLACGLPRAAVLAVGAPLDDPLLIRAAAKHVAGASFVIAQLEIPLECVFEAAKLARSKGSKFVLDPAPPVELPESLLRLVDILRANSTRHAY